MPNPNTAIYTTSAIYELEQQWFKQGNSAFGLMAQAGFLLALEVDKLLTNNPTYANANIAIWCGTGNNGGDGYVVACHLTNLGYEVVVVAPEPPKSTNAKIAHAQAVQAGVPICDLGEYAKQPSAGVHIDALFGIGLVGEVAVKYQVLIDYINAQTGLKIALDVPSGLNADTPSHTPYIVRADWTLTPIGLKLAHSLGAGRAFVGQVVVVPLLPPNEDIAPVAYLGALPKLSKRHLDAHKGNFGFVAVVGGQRTMGGAVILSALSAMAVGAGRVSVACDTAHHGAILAHNPAIMTADSAMTAEAWEVFLGDKTLVCLGMGLGRDEGAGAIFETVVGLCKKLNKRLIIDADGLYHLAKTNLRLNDDWIATPHSAEAGRLLGVAYDEIDKDKVSAINAMQVRYGGAWVLKGAGSLTLENGKLHLCPYGNAGMATAGMGDVLAGATAGLVAQMSVSLAECVAVHAKAGDELAKAGEFGLSAYEMMRALKAVVNGCVG